MTVTLTTDDEGRRTLLAALDLYQRVAMGQWREIVEAAPNVVGDVSVFGSCGDELMRVRANHTIVEALTHPNAHLGISLVHERAVVASDLWHALGGGMESRQGDRLTSTRIAVSFAPGPPHSARDDRKERHMTPVITITAEAYLNDLRAHRLADRILTALGIDPYWVQEVTLTDAEVTVTSFVDGSDPSVPACTATTTRTYPRPAIQEDA